MGNWGARSIEFEGPGLDSPELQQFEQRARQCTALCGQIEKAEDHDELNAMRFKIDKLQASAGFDHIEVSQLDAAVGRRYLELMQQETEKIESLEDLLRIQRYDASELSEEEHVQTKMSTAIDFTK